MRGLKDKVAVVTGGSRGIGAAIVKRLYEEGVRVACISRNPPKIEALSGMDPTRLQYYGTDMAVGDQIATVAKQIVEDFSGIDFLINNAGITRDGLFMRMSDAQWDEVLTTNLTGPMRLTRALTRSLMKSSQGRIVNIGSVVGVTGNVGQANYTAAKAGLIGLTKTLARELSSRGVTANVVCPGFIETDMTAGIPADKKEQFMKEIPLARFGKPEDIAGLVAFLCSAEASYITGQVICSDGGLIM